MGFERKTFNMDMDWRFHRGDVNFLESTDHSAVYGRVKAGAEIGPAAKKTYDDSRWERVNLPHDYIRESEFSPNAVGDHGYKVKCNGWYRKTFDVDPALKGKHALLVFDGISTDSIIYLNGSIMERNFDPYSEIIIDVSDRLYYDRVNTLAVYTKGDAFAGWWYEGAGIYRHAHLFIKNSVHIAHNGLWANPIQTVENSEKWEVKLEAELENSIYEDQTVSVYATLLKDGIPVAEGTEEGILCAADRTTVAKLTLPIENPALWDVDAPNLYTLKVEVRKDGEVVDGDSTRIGFRTFRFDADKGFFLNGRSLKIKGTCNHQDHAGVGVAVPDSVQYYRVRRLKEMGCNAYRSAHNLPAKEILDACDEYGLLVMDENRFMETRRDVMRNVENMVRRDRNHPSVILWSMFNEEPLQNTTEGAAIFRRMRSAVRKLDPTRPVIGAINDSYHPGGSGEYMEVFGRNYGIKGIPRDHALAPHKPILGTENNSAVTTRGCYESDREGAHVLNGYDEEAAPWGQTVRETWKMVRELDYFSGIFIWTGFDYRGEPTPFTWPSCSSQFGIMDTCGFPKDSYYFNQAVFLDEPMIYILPHWNWEEGKTVRVMTVSNCDEVELFLNGKSLGRRPNDPCEQNEWKVVFEAGTLSAVGYRKGEAVAKTENKTAGKAVAIRLIPDRPFIGNGGQDTVPVRVSVLDAQGTEIPTASDKIEFFVEGDGFVAGVGNGDPNSHEPDHLPYRKLYCGLCQVLVTAKTKAKSLKLIARGEGLEEAQITLQITEQPIPDYIYSKPNLEISGILTSVSDSAEKPDPAKIYSDNDMNSFAPMSVSSAYNNAYCPGRFESGWRELRIPIELPDRIPEGKAPILKLASVIAETVEFYRNGTLIYQQNPAHKASVSVPLPADTKTYELRCLIKAAQNVPANGISISIALTMEDK